MQPIQITDTTLRDGEQMPGVIFSSRQKIELAERIFDFGIDNLELMPGVSKSEVRVAEYLVKAGFSDKLTASTLLRKDHIDLAKSIGINKITLFTSLSDIHLEYKLNISRKQNLESSLKYVDYAKEQGLCVDFAGEDSSRADSSYLIDFINTLEGKVNYFLPCDTLGVLTSRQTYEFIKRLKQETNCKIGLHIHNDFGQSTANTLSGLEAGADMFSGTFTGIGERAGNAPIEEVVIALRFQYGQVLNLKYNSIGELCSLVEKYSRVKVQKHKPICGENAFSHESGIHVDGLLKSLNNYEIFDPDLIGRKRNILFGKHSGTSSLRYLFGDRFTSQEYQDMLFTIKSTSEKLRSVFSESEILRMYQEN